jgi:hypothetical protein
MMIINGLLLLTLTLLAGLVYLCLDSIRQAELETDLALSHLAYQIRDDIKLINNYPCTIQNTSITADLSEVNVDRTVLQNSVRSLLDDQGFLLLIEDQDLSVRKGYESLEYWQIFEPALSLELSNAASEETASFDSEAANHSITNGKNTRCA